jgi:PAS domain S-box-containing protein
MQDKRAEEELAKNRAILQAAVESLPFDFFAIGLDGRYIIQNGACRTHWGEVVGKCPEDVCTNEDDLAVWLDNNRRAFGGEKVEGEVALTVQGDKRFYYNVIAPIRDDRQTYGILGVNIDITERKRAEAALRKAHDELEQRVEARTADLSRANGELAVFRRFAEASGQGFAMADLAHHLTYANPAILGLMGVDSPADVVGENLLSFHSEQLQKMIREVVIPAILREGRWTGEVPVRGRAGQERQTLADAFLVRNENGEPSHFAVVVTDITQRKRAEGALRQSHAELQAIYDGMRDGLLIADLETKRFVRTNAAICRMLGFSEDELLSRSVMDIHPAEVLPAVLESFQGQAEGRIQVNENAPVLRKDGRVFFADISANGILYDGRPCVIGLFRDVTERREAQEALEKERRTLQHMLQASDHERQLIAYDIHDGLAQQLAGALMHLQTFDHLKDEDPPQAAAAYQAGMALLRQSHFEARRLISGVRPPILDESGITAAIAHLVHDQSVDRGPKIEFRSKVAFNRLAPVLENAVYRIVQEGLTNACKHSKSPKVRVGLIQHGERVRVEIRDWGIGFQPKTVKKDCYGLEGIRQRARLLGGRAVIQSAPGKGTRIRVELPLVASTAEAVNSMRGQAVVELSDRAGGPA